MNVEVARRAFVGSVVAGLPLLAGTGSKVAWAQGTGDPVPIQDPLLNQLVNDMKQAVRGLSRANSGEQARRLASSFRLLSAWGVSNQFDVRVKEALSGAVALQGREAVLLRNVDFAMFNAEARELGFDGSSAVPLPTLPTVDDAMRQRVLDSMLSDGVTARWRQLADTLDAAAVQMDRRASTQRGGVTLAQFDSSYCSTLSQELFYLSVEMAFWCAPWFWWIPEPCGLATSAYLGVVAAYWWLGCV